ncbi:MAG: glycerophosphodiester phosphodiesterase [Opitutaceae bacterium]|nr:glycerophosphodiester phosphodiesterase [Verrucomicrobiales bacterium]
MNSPNPFFLCIGHRGAMGHVAENTLASIRKALELGARCVEIDVYHVDRQLVVFHDDRLERTTNGRGNLWDQTFDYLRSLDAGGGEQIPTLEEVCREIEGRACINIELKGPNTAAPVASFIGELIGKGWSYKSILVSSFDHSKLEETKRLDPLIQLGVLIERLRGEDAEFAAGLGAFSLHPSLKCVDQHFVDDAHARNMNVYVYTVNDPADIARMHGLGVDGVFTNFPERVVAQYAQPGVEDGWTGRRS